jgi:hypothetical protein
VSACCFGEIVVAGRRVSSRATRSGGLISCEQSPPTTRRLAAGGEWTVLGLGSRAVVGVGAAAAGGVPRAAVRPRAWHDACGCGDATTRPVAAGPTLLDRALAVVLLLVSRPDGLPSADTEGCCRGV